MTSSLKRDSNLVHLIQKLKTDEETRKLFDLEDEGENDQTEKDDGKDCQFLIENENVIALSPE